MKTWVIIPARYASTRYPGKPLVPLIGATGEGRSLIRRSWDVAQATSAADRVVVATDDHRIAKHCADFGAEVAMTPETCRNGTERCAAALAPLGIADADIVINLQGDAPLTPPWFLGALADAMTGDTQVATPVLRLDAEGLDSFRRDRAAGRVGGTTAVFDRDGRALYFSKEVIPYTGALDPAARIPVFHHVGVYAYRPAALRAYAGWPEAHLEGLEGLEQLRFMENGVPVACVEVDARGQGFWELNNPEDVPRIEAILKDLGRA
ncbi:MAG: manno-octulosonate cytidylyltransferase [Pseudomonadota bacterium]